MGEIAKYGGMVPITDEDMRRRTEDNAKATAEVAELAVISDYAYVPAYWRIDGEPVIITVAKAPAEGTFRHADCEPTNG